MLRYLKFLQQKLAIYIRIILYLFQVNSVLFIMLLCRINRASKFSESLTRVQNVKAWLRRSLILLPVLGITWSFGLLTFISSTIVFHYLFTIFNSLQGFVIFFNFCVLDSEVGFLVILATTVNLDCKIVGFSLEINSSSSSRRGVREAPLFQPSGLVFPESRHSLFLITLNETFIKRTPLLRGRGHLKRAISIVANLH